MGKDGLPGMKGAGGTPGRKGLPGSPGVAVHLYTINSTQAQTLCISNNFIAFIPIK